MDWTNELSDIEDGQKTPPSTKYSTLRHNLTNKITKENLIIEIERKVAGQNLGFQIATRVIENSEIVLVKQINSEPALSANLMVNDIILAVNFFN